MKKFTLYVCGSLSVFAWVAMTYFLFVHRPSVSLEEARRSRIGALEGRVQEFEAKLNVSLEESSAFLAKLKDASHSKSSSHSNEVISIKANLDSKMDAGKVVSKERTDPEVVEIAKPVVQVFLKA